MIVSLYPFSYCNSAIDLCSIQMIKRYWIINIMFRIRHKDKRNMRVHACVFIKTHIVCPRVTFFFDFESILPSNLTVLCCLKFACYHFHQKVFVGLWCLLLYRFIFISNFYHNFFCVHFQCGMGHTQCHKDKWNDVGCWC